MHKIPAFKLIDQNGDTITDKTFDDKYYVTNFFFTTCPGICPQMTSNMAVLQDSFAYDNDVLLLSRSVTPTRDSVPALRAYAEEYDVSAQKWFLVTGEQQEIYRLGRRAYFIEEDLGIAKDLYKLTYKIAVIRIIIYSISALESLAIAKAMSTPACQ